jgi:hypothetical protein
MSRASEFLAKVSERPRVEIPGADDDYSTWATITLRDNGDVEIYNGILSKPTILRAAIIPTLLAWLRETFE